MDDQLFLARYGSWQPPQFFCTSGNVALKLASSFTLAAASLASAPNLANLASTSAFFSQIAGSAAVSPPVLEFSGNSDGILAAASWYCAKIAFALARSNGSSPFTYLAPNAACWPLAFISALRAAIGSCAIAVERPSARAVTASTVRLIGCSPCVGAEARMKSWVDLEQPPDGRPARPVWPSKSEHRRYGVI